MRCESSEGADAKAMERDYSSPRSDYSLVDPGVLGYPSGTMASTALSNAYAFRRGKEFVVPRSASLPPTCLKCGASATTPWRKRFYWHTPVLYLMIIFPGILIYAIVAMFVRKTMELNLPLCERHHADRKRYKLLATLMFVGCLPAGLVLGSIGSEALGWVTGSVMLIAAVVFSQLFLLGIRATKIDDIGGTFRGACDTFLKLLPDEQ